MRGLLLALATAGATLGAIAAPASADIAPPWQLEQPSAGVLRARPVDGVSTLAVTVARSPAGDLVFSPAPQTVPSGFPAPAPGALSYNRPAAQAATGLRLQGDIVEVSVLDVTTSVLTIVGGREADKITVQDPTTATGDIGLLDITSEAGADEIHVGARVHRILDDPGLSDTSDDRYTITSTTIDIASTISPEGGDDIVTTADADISVDGGDDNDTLSGPGVLKGGAGDDELKPTNVTRKVDGEDGTDRLSYEALPQIPAPNLVIELTGGANADVSSGGVTTQMSGVEQIEGGPGNDTLIGSDAGADLLAGGAGNDRLQGLGAADVLDGGPGTDTVSYAEAPGAVSVDLGTGSGGTAGAMDVLSSFEAVIGSAGIDTVTGTAATESFDLSAGDDVVFAGAGNDRVLAGPGNDTMRGGPGSDTLNGEAGSDTALYDERGPGEPVTVSLTTVGDDGTPGENDALLGVESVVGGAGNDVLSGDDGPNALSGNGGNDTISGLDGPDTLHGGEGRDIVSGDLGSDQLFGDGGDDSLLAFDNISDTLDCGDGSDDDAQVDGLDRAENCEFPRRLDVLPPADGDGDGVIAGTDCNDDNAAIKPGAKDPPGDGIDQNCDGKDSATPVLAATLRIASAVLPRRGGTQVAALEVLPPPPSGMKLPAGTQAVITCRATPQSRRVKGKNKPRCLFSRKTKNLGSSKKIALTSFFALKRKPVTLPIGTRVELTISAPGYVSQVVRYTVRRTATPRREDFCLPPGAKAPTACVVDDGG